MEQIIPQALKRNKLCLHHDLTLLASRTVNEKRLLFKLSGLWYFLHQPQDTNPPTKHVPVTGPLHLPCPLLATLIS